MRVRWLSVIQKVLGAMIGIAVFPGIVEDAQKWPAFWDGYVAPLLAIAPSGGWNYLFLLVSILLLFGEPLAKRASRSRWPWRRPAVNPLLGSASDLHHELVTWLDRRREHEPYRHADQPNDSAFRATRDAYEAETVRQFSERFLGRVDSLLDQLRLAGTPYVELEKRLVRGVASSLVVGLVSFRLGSLVESLGENWE